ncbi:MAG: sigma factor-like helix-turn-helix DNA-binding protein [Pirellulales bacterium]
MTSNPVRPEPDPPWLPLLRKFLQALEAAFNDPDRGHSIWLIFVADAWFRSEVARIAARVVPPGWKSDLIDEVAQQAMLLFLRELRHRFDLGVDRKKVEETFPAWIGSIIENDCREALRRIQRVRADQGAWPLAEPWLDQRRSMEKCRHISELVEKLKHPARAIVQLVILEYEMSEIAEMLNIPERTAYHHFNRARRRLRDQLEKDEETDL